MPHMMLAPWRYTKKRTVQSDIDNVPWDELGGHFIWWFGFLQEMMVVLRLKDE